MISGTMTSNMHMDELAAQMGLLNLPQSMRVPKGAARLESLVGALFLDAGLERVSTLLVPMLLMSMLKLIKHALTTEQQFRGGNLGPSKTDRVQATNTPIAAAANSPSKTAEERHTSRGELRLPPKDDKKALLTAWLAEKAPKALATLEYRVIGHIKGPLPEYRVQCYMAGRQWPHGWGPTQDIAEQAAAALAIGVLDAIPRTASLETWLLENS